MRLLNVHLELAVFLRFGDAFDEGFPYFIAHLLFNDIISI